MARHYINFRDSKYLYFHEFRQYWKKLYPEIHIMLCTCEYKKSTRIIFMYKDKRLTYYLKDEVAEKMTLAYCITILKDMLDREWYYDEYCNRY